MIDAFLRPLSHDEPTEQEEAFALLWEDISSLLPSLKWAELREIGRKRPERALRAMESLHLTGDLAGVSLYIEGKPVGVCFWGEEEPGQRPTVACLFLAREHQGAGLEQMLLQAMAG